MVRHNPGILLSRLIPRSVCYTFFMRRLIISLVLSILVFFAVSGSPVSAQRYAQCDVCGYCQGMTKPPGSWQDCRKCMYDGFGSANMDAASNKTLQVVDNANSPYYNIQVTPRPGHYYTQIGCITTDLASFSAQGASGSVVGAIMRVIFNITGGIAFLYLIYGAYVVITARGEPTALNRGRSIIFGAIIGLIFVMLITIILNLVGNGILRIPGFGV